MAPTKPNHAGNSVKKPIKNLKQVLSNQKAQTKNKARSGKSKLKPLDRSNAVKGDDDFSNEDDLMLPEDKELLKGVNESGDESVEELEVDGEDIDEAEIFSFLKKLNVSKFQPFPSSSETSKAPEISNKASKTQVTESTSKDKNKKKAGNAGLESSISDTNAALQYLKTYKSRTFLLLKPGEMWREEEIEPLPTSAPDEKLVNEAEKLAQRLLTDEIAVYTKQKENTKRSEARWLKTVLATGTLSDKMAALTLLVQESPIHNLSSLETLISMAGKKGRREAMMAVDTLRDLYLTGLLPDDRKLKTFKQHPLQDLQKMTSGNIESRDKLLLMWYFESKLKKKYEEFIKALGDMSFDNLQATKEKAIATIHQLLTSKPEQENVLLPMLVNKLGDQAIKSKTMYLLTRLVDEHPNMKPIIIREVQHLLHRPNVSQRAQYYAICFLTQLRLSKEQSSEATELIKIYFYFFQNYLKKGEVDNKMMSALLTGVNRAVVYAEDMKTELMDQIDAVYKIIPSVNFHTGVQALMLLYQVTDASSNAADRFYMSLYRKLGDPALKNSSKQAIFMNLLFKSLKRDLVDRRIKAFIKRILQVYSQHAPQTICGILILLSQILKDKPGLLDFKHIVKAAWAEDDDEEEKFVDLPAPDEFEDKREKEEKRGENESGEGNEEENKFGENNKASMKATWVHRRNQSGQEKGGGYDPYGRNPLYAKADVECMWELQDLSKHYHPSVRLYAQRLLKGEPIEYDGDPMKDFTLIRFLDRFVYKNPKKQTDQKTSTMKKFKKQNLSGVRSIPVNSEDFLKMDEQDVPDDEKFFYRYFKERAKRQPEGKDSDTESITDADFDAYLDAYEKGMEDGDDDLGDYNLDFAGAKKKTGSKKGKQNGEDEDESEGSDDDDFDDDDEDMDFEDDDLADEFRAEMADLEAQDSDAESFGDAGADNTFDENEVEFSPDEDDELKMMMLGGGKKRKRDSGLPDFTLDSGRKGKKRKRDATDLFASAEQFSHLLEEDTESGKVSLGGTADVSNTDRAAQKQLKWEADRDNWTKGKNKKRPNKMNNRVNRKGQKQNFGGKGKRPNKFGKKK